MAENGGRKWGLTPFSEKLASMLTLDYLRREASQGRRQDFERYLNAVPDVPDEVDKTS